MNYQIESLGGQYIRESMRSATSADLDEVIKKAMSYLGYEAFDTETSEGVMEVFVGGKPGNLRTAILRASPDFATASPRAAGASRRQISVWLDDDGTSIVSLDRLDASGHAEWTDTLATFNDRDEAFEYAADQAVAKRLPWESRS